MADEISTGELRRNQERFEKRVEIAISGMVTKDQFQSAQDGTNHRFENQTKATADVATDLATEKAERVAADKDLQAQNNAQRDALAAYEKEQQSTRSRWTLTWVGLISAPIVAAIFALLLKGGPPSP